MSSWRINGIGKVPDFKKISDVYFGECETCKKMVVLELICQSKKFTVYWIPVAKWQKEFFIFCPKCDSGIKVSVERVEELKKIGENMPNKKLIIEAWQDAMNYHANNFYNSTRNGELDKDYITNLKGHLRKLEYGKDIIDYVIPIYIENIIETSCLSCGENIVKNSSFCNKCGAKTNKF